MPKTCGDTIHKNRRFLYIHGHARYFISDDAGDATAGLQPFTAPWWAGWLGGLPQPSCRGTYPGIRRHREDDYFQVRQLIRPPGARALGIKRMSRPPAFLKTTWISHMNSESTRSILHHEIANLAFLNWQKDGCPSGRDQHYWLEAEQQIRATKHLLIGEVKPSNGNPAPPAKAKSKRAPKRPALAASAK
jgi:hypothetical protein